MDSVSEKQMTNILVVVLVLLALYLVYRRCQREEYGFGSSGAGSYTDGSYNSSWSGVSRGSGGY